MTYASPHLHARADDVPFFFRWESTAIGEESEMVTRAIEISLREYFIPISRESIPVVRFQRLKDIWKEETAFLSSVSDIAMHAAYQQIIGMGSTAVPLIMREMGERPAQWFWALKSIAGEDPVPPEHRGNVTEMTRIWLRWGKERGYIS